MRREVSFVLTMVPFLKYAVEAWARWFFGPALISHSSALRR